VNESNNDYDIYADEEDNQEEIWEKCKAYYETRVLSEIEIIESIENNTQEQSKNDSWYYYRMKRLTASHFGDICRALVDNSKLNIVKQMIYKNNQKKFIPKPIQYGLDNEFNALELYSQSQNCEVTRSGLRISNTHPFIGCSPDGLIFNYDENIISNAIEIKCPYGFKDFTLEEMKKSKEFYMKYDEESKKFNLKKTHQYYYQVQGIINILKVDSCDFIVYTPKNQLIIETIGRDTDFWNNIMLPKLKKFYFRYYLPELVLGRFEEKRTLFIFEEEFYDSVIEPYIT